MLRSIDPSIWVNEVSFKLLGIDFGNRMTCIQLADQSFWLHSPTKFDHLTYKEITTKGNIKYLVAPSLMHNLFIMKWKQQGKESQVLAPSQAKKLHSDIPLEKTPEDQLSQLFNGEIRCIPIKGMPVLQEYAFIHHASKTLILTDLAFNFGEGVTGWAKLFMKLYGAYNKFGPTLTVRALIKDKRAFSESIQEVMSYDFDRIIVSHGDIVDSNGKTVFKQAFKKYLQS